VDVAVLQQQNQTFVQQSDAQKHELHELECSIKELEMKQTSYDDILIRVNKMWNQLTDDIVLLQAQAGAGPSAFQFLRLAESSRGSIPSCPMEDIFLCRLLGLDGIKSRKDDEFIAIVNESLQLRQTSTVQLMKLLEEAIYSQRAKFNDIAQILQGKPSAEDAVIQLHKLDGLIKEEVSCLHEVMNMLCTIDKQYADEIQACVGRHSIDESEIKRLAGRELDDILLDLEESRRKLINMKMQKEGISGMRVPIPVPCIPDDLNGTVSPEKPVDRSKRLRELKESIEEMKALAEDRLSELRDSREDNSALSKQLNDLQNELNGDKYVCSSRSYSMLNDQLQHWTVESERYRSLFESLQAERPTMSRRVKDLTVKSEALDSSRTAIGSSESKIEELQNLLQICVIEKNELERKMEEAIQDSGRRDIKEEFQVMTSALTKEMDMMEKQLNKWKQRADEAIALREQTQSLNALLDLKTSELQNTTSECSQQMEEITSLMAAVEKMQTEKQELEIFLDMWNHQMLNSRDSNAIKESERKAHLQAEAVRTALEEHSLEFRVKAAHEAEVVCQQRLSVAEVEIAELRAQLEASERDVLELKEAVKLKEEEADSYISEIETIGQAYEDMQTQNQHLRQQLTDRNEYNIKLVSDSVKEKQFQNVLQSEKQGLESQLQYLNGCLEGLKSRIARNDEQMKVQLVELPTLIREEKHSALKLESAKWELADAEKELKILKSALSLSEKEQEQIQRKLDDIKKELDRER
ncbi:hypothetical protein M569_12905, partial [Genlisea aurea]